MGKFKAGDRARLTKDNCGYGREGDEVSIIDVDDDSAYCRFDYTIGGDTDWFVPITSLVAITTNNAYTSNPAAEVDNPRDEYGPVGAAANDNDLGSTAGFTVPVLDGEDATIRYEDGRFIVNATSFMPSVAPATSGKFKVGEEVAYVNPEFGTAKVLEVVDDEHVKVDTRGMYGICTEHVKDLRLVAPATSGKEDGAMLAAITEEAKANIADIRLKTADIARRLEALEADKPKTLKRGDLVVFNRPAMITGIDKYMVSVQTDGGNYSLPRAALRAA